MKIEGYSEKDMSNVTTLKNAIEARHIYERARLENPTRDRIPMSRGPLKIGVDPTIYTIITGIQMRIMAQQCFSIFKEQNT